jgi:hypothetical protein
VKALVVSLRTFSRLDEGEFKTVDVHEGIDSVLMFLRRRSMPRRSGTWNCGPVIRSDAASEAGPMTTISLTVAARSVPAVNRQRQRTSARPKAGEKPGQSDPRAPQARSDDDRAARQGLAPRALLLATRSPVSDKKIRQLGRKGYSISSVSFPLPGRPKRSVNR